MMGIEKVWGLLAAVVGAALTIWAGYMTYTNTILFPEPIYMLRNEILLLIGAILTLLITGRNALYLGNILSAAALVFAIYNSVLIRIFQRFAEPYVNYIISQPSFYPYTAETAITCYKYFMIAVGLILAVSWLRYTVIMKHNMVD